MKMQHFDSVADALQYVASELAATLNDDLERMQGSEEEHYTDEDRSEMAAKIADVEAVEDFIVNSADLREALCELLKFTVDDDLAHGIALTEGEQQARDKALEVLGRIDTVE